MMPEYGTEDVQLSQASNGIDSVDAGRLFVALNNLRADSTLNAYNSTLVQRINNIVNNKVAGQEGNRTNYSTIVPSILSISQNSNSIYTYYFVSGWASFFSKQLGNLPNTILNNLFKNTPTVNMTVQGTPLNVTLPNAANYM